MVTPALPIANKPFAILTSDTKVASLRKNTHIIAITTFANGPATATIAISLRGCLKLRALTGTGFAQPNAKPESKTIAIGTTIVPMVRSTPRRAVLYDLFTLKKVSLAQPPANVNML